MSKKLKPFNPEEMQSVIEKYTAPVFFECNQIIDNIVNSTIRREDLSYYVRKNIDQIRTLTTDNAHVIFSYKDAYEDVIDFFNVDMNDIEFVKAHKDKHDRLLTLPGQVIDFSKKTKNNQ